MFDAILFASLMVITVLLYVTWRLRGRSWVDYFKTKDGLGILRGLVIAPLAILAIGFVLWLLSTPAHAGSWLNDASVFAGLDYTRKLSPQCERNAIDERGTSNLGVVLNVWESDSRAVRVNSKYTHHSCALGVDDRQYDALGVELVWRVWGRER